MPISNHHLAQSVILFAYYHVWIADLYLIPDDDNARARKRQRIDDIPARSMTMRLPESDQESQLSISPDFTTPAMAGPSSQGLDGPTLTTNGHTLPSLSPTNGHSATNGVSANGVQKHGKGVVPRVHIPGTLLHDDMTIDREEFVRLVVQSLRDVGYTYVAPRSCPQFRC